MVYSRYDNKRIITNSSERYMNILIDRGLKRIRQYSLSKLSYPTDKEMQNLKTVAYLWKGTDRVYNVSHEFYGDVRLWWLICWFNQKPTEFHFEEGETIFIPFPLEKTLQIFNRGS